MSQIKSYTTNFSMKIPEFNIATWHDAMEYNFTLIDALLGNFFEANNFKGPWLIVTGYNANDIVYITDEDDQYVGKIFKVLQDHVSGNTKFETFYAEHPEYYEEYADINGVLNYFTLAKDYAIKMDGKVVENGTEIDFSAKYYANESANSAILAGEHETNAFTYKTGAESAKNSAEGYANAAQGYMNNAEQYKDDALSSKNNASDSATLAIQAKIDAQSAANSASSSQTGAETAEQNAQTSAINASNSASNAATSESNALNYSQSAETYASNAHTSEINAHDSELAIIGSVDDAKAYSIVASEKATEASGYSLSASTSATNAYTWAEGLDEQVSILGGEKSAKGWANKAKEIAEGIGNVYKPAGSIAFENLPALSSDIQGYVYNITNNFTTTSDFVEGAGNSYPAGTNIVCLDTGSSVYKWDVLAGIVDLSGYVPTSRTINGKDLSSNISLNASDVGALPNTTVVPTINSTNNYVPYRSGASTFANSSLLYNSNAMAFTGRLHVGSSSPASYYNKGKFTIYDNTPSQQVSSIALLNYGGGGGCGVAIDMYNTSANGGIPSGKFGLVDNGNYSGYLQLQVKKSGAASNPLLPAMNIVPVPAANSLTTCVSFGQDEFNRVLFDLHKPEASCTITDTDKRWGGSGTTYQVTGSNKFNPRLLVAVGDIVSFDNFSTEATVTGVVSNNSTCQITVNQTLGTISNKNISVKKAYFKITDENYNIKFYVDPYGKFGIGTGTPSTELDVSGTINASTDIKIGGNSLATVAKTGNYNDLLNTPTIPSTASDVNALPDSTKYGADLSYSSNTLQLKDQDGNNLGNSVTIQSSPDIDSKSITKNSSQELQTVGVIDQRDTTTALKQWSGTKAQYDAIVSKDANTIYNVKDEPNTFQSLLETIYPVGSIYIGTMNVCPMSALFGTWQLVSTKILTDIPATLGAKGNGITLGLTDATENFGLVSLGQQWSASYQKSSYNKNVGENAPTNEAYISNKIVGITTDPTKSGIVADTNATSLTVNVWQRTE